MKRENTLNALYNNETIKIEELEKFREDIKLSGYEYYAYYDNDLNQKDVFCFIDLEQVLYYIENVYNYYEVQEEPFHYFKI